MFKISKVKGGKVKLYQQLDKLKSGKGTPAVKKNYDDVENETIQELQNVNLKEGSGVPKTTKRIKNIKPLVFKL